tara:strand:+ start:16 stop:1173 length:1158 start_codon:yes stop_codon:yes gene_type:complete
MKKILFICPRNPFSERYSGDVIRAKKTIYFLSKNHYVKVISSDFKNSQKKESKLSYEGFKEISLISKIFYIFFSFIKLRPIQLGYFFSPKIKEYVQNNFQDYDLIFFQSFRTAQYMPEGNNKTCILDMGDLMSKNYKQTSVRYFFFNPIRVIYYIESLLVKRYESFCFKKFTKILLHSKREIDSVEKKFKGKLAQFSFGVTNINKKYSFHQKNFKIIFIGNIKYAPNKKACYEFANKILPLINEIYPNIEFHIIGEISKIDKFLLKKKTNVKILGKIKNLDPYLDKTICGIANLKIATGIQTKLLTYMSYGIPSVCSQEVIKNFDAIKESKTSFYKNNEEMIKIILKYKRNKNFSLNASKRALKTIKKFKWEKVLPVLDKVLNKY